ncbi:MAG: c-type cytochrome [Moorea sp. SIO4E2]|uniref:c-type cytochrome n=1 Tax=Moorena sp. SIO4E2 TaxID=2607826 RepID=UPI0013B6CC0C|nr:c-type cytochrome [Moorena sp. SIO4E2]NEQ06972.1 c-type cytochrome [Moorena sp. SIO4E2]
MRQIALKKLLSLLVVTVCVLTFTYGCAGSTTATVPPETTPAPTAAVTETVESPAEPTEVAEEETAPAEPTEVAEEETAPAEPTEVAEEETAPAEPTEVAEEETAPAEPTEVAEEETTPAEPTEVAEEETTPAEPVEVAVAVDEAALAKSGQLFASNCASCHKGGNNLLNPQKTLKKDILEKYGMYSKDKIVYQITNGKPPMPAFKGRLKADQIAALADYVLYQADNGWQ